MQGNTTSQRGFTLIELSIVLVIIGLIVGGVLVGQSLIRAAEVQSVLTDVRKFVTAIHTFQVKYDAYPGDMTNATAVWGAAAGNVSDNYTASCYGTQGTGTQTCNGNGDGKIFADGTDPYGYEMFLAWQHLANAGLVAGAYTGVPGSGSTFQAVAGVNVPQSRIAGAGFTLLNYVHNASDSFPANYGHTFIFGSYFSGGTTAGPVLTAQDAYGIDHKIDDGMPASGSVMSFTPDASFEPNCTTSSDPTAAQYNTSTPGVNCSLIFITGF